MRHELAQRLNIRYTPEILFRLDESIERGTRILQLIQEMESQGQATAASGDELRTPAAAIDGPEHATEARAPQRNEQP